MPRSPFCATVSVAHVVELDPTASFPVGDTGSLVIDRDQVERALRRLEPGMRAVVVAHFFLGQPLPEVAAALGIPLGTAKSRLHRSLAAMRSELTAAAGTDVLELQRGPIV